MTLEEAREAAKALPDVEVGKWEVATVYLREGVWSVKLTRAATSVDISRLRIAGKQAQADRLAAGARIVRRVALGTT